MDEKQLLFGKYTHWQVNENTYFITTLNGTLYMYLLVGEKNALLIDTAYGYGNLREYVEKLTDKPIITVNTHGHFDHSGGNACWEKVYMHENAIMDMERPEEFKIDLNIFLYPDYKKVFIKEGFLFNLGNRTIEVIDISAHSNGSFALLDRNSRLIFTGDEIEAQQIIMFGNFGQIFDLKERIAKHLTNMQKLKSREKDFDFICPGHNGAPISKSYLDDYIELDKAILQGRHFIAPSINHFFLEQLPFADKLKRAVFNNAAIIYMQNDL